MGTDRTLSLTTSLTVKTRKTLMTLLALLLLVSAFVLAFPQVKASAASNMTRAVRAAADSVIEAQDAEIPQALQKLKKSPKLKEAQKESLEKLFEYVSSEDFGYARESLANRQYRLKNKNWYLSYANAMLATKKGSCYSFAAAYAVLAKRATKLPVRVCVGKSILSDKAFWQEHAWVEVKVSGKWCTFDPNGARFYKTRTTWAFISAKEAKKTYRKTGTLTVTV